MTVTIVTSDTFTFQNVISIMCFSGSMSVNYFDTGTMTMRTDVFQLDEIVSISVSV